MPSETLAFKLLRRSENTKGEKMLFEQAKRSLKTFKGQQSGSDETHGNEQEEPSNLNCLFVQTMKRPN